MKTRQEIQTIIERMSPQQKAGQLFLLAYPGKAPQIIQPLIEKYGICGCYISQDNAGTFAEAEASTTALQAMSMENHNLPLLLGVDQEGSWGILVPESHTGPGNLALGAALDDSIVKDIYRVFGKEMLSAGYNAILGPCADVNSNPRSPIIGTRSFGEFPERVACCVEAAVKGIRSSGNLAAVKHFPGHGATEADTHRLIPEVHKSLEELRKQDLLPFLAGIKAGAHIIMTSHIRYPRIDPEYPATLSKKILRDMLRTEMEFKGIILSDSMNMGAIRKFYDPAESTLLALKAGVDVVMLSEEHYDHSGAYLQKQIASIEIVKQAIESGDLSKDEVNEKLFRILDLKFNNMVVKGSALKADETDEFIQIENRAADMGFTLLQKGLWPLPEKGLILCINASPRESYNNIVNIRGIGPNQAVPAFDTFRETCEKLSKDFCFIPYEDVGHPDTVSQLEKAAALVLVTEDYPLPGEDFQKEKQQSLVKTLAEKYRAKMIILGLRSSYELSLYPESVTYLCSYSSRTCSARQGAILLAERREQVFGTAPVTARF
jgi:beta-N-acetylhexosaminidase